MLSATNVIQNKTSGMESIRKKIEKTALLKWRVRECIEKGEYQQAIHHHLQMGMNNRISFNVASLYRKIGDVQSAEKYYTMAVELDPWLSIGHYMLGLTLQEKGEYQAAIDAYDNCLISLRKHESIEYTQIGLDLTLRESNIRFNHLKCFQKIGESSGDCCKSLSICSYPYELAHRNEMLLFRHKRNTPFYNNVFQGHLGSKVIAKTASTNFCKMFKVKFVVD